MSENVSEVARIRRQIELECESAKLALEGYSIIAQHTFIQRRYDNIASYQKELEQQVGKKEAIQLVYEVYMEVIG